MIDSNERLVTDEINRLVPVLGKETANKISRAYLLGDETVRERIFEILDAVKAAVMTKEGMGECMLMEPPPESVAANGDILIGNVNYGNRNMYPLLLKKASLLTHIGVFGSSGYGKTNISYSLIKQLSDNDVPVIVFDFSKRNYRDLISAGMKDRMDIYTVGKNTSPLKFNPLIPPEGVLSSQWMKEFSSIFDHAYWLLGGGRHIILKAMDSVSRTKENPRLGDLRDWIVKYGATNMPARERNWLATAERPFESLCFKELGEVFDCDKGITPSEFFSPGRVTVLELDALDSSDKTFFIEITLQWIRDWLLVSGSREILKGVIILEEAHHVLNREKSKKLGSETVMDLIFREIRELGMGMVYIDQHPSLVSFPALGNTSNHIYMNLGLDTQYSSDVQDASSMLGLNYVDQGYYLRKLPVGSGFVLCRNSPFPHAFLVKFEQFPIKKGYVTDQMVASLMNGRNAFMKDSPLMKSQSRPGYVAGNGIGMKLDIEPVINGLQSNEWELIKILGSGQATFASQIYRLVNISGGMFKKRSQKLVDKGVVGLKTAKMRKNRMNYYYLTELGEAIYEKAFPTSGKKPELKTGGDSRMKASRDAFQSLSPSERIEPVELKDILENLSFDGWKCELVRRRNHEGNEVSPSNEPDTLIIKKGEQNFNIHIKNSADRVPLSPSENFFLCSSPVMKNLTIQKAARLSADFNKGFTIFISTVKDFSESGELEEIEFLV
jgi:predicted transcriptional regulator